jgi:CRP-like cAMP-binding protein
MLSRGDLLVRAGSPQSEIVYLTEGKLALYRANKKRQIALLLGVVSSPAIVGDAEAFGNTPWMCSIRAEQETTCLLIDNDAFFEVVQGNRELAYRMYRDASIRHLLANHTAQTVALYDVETRLLRLLLDCARQHGRIEGDRAFVGRKLSQVELAASLGVATRTVARALKPMIARGNISEGDGGALVIHGLAALTSELPADLLGLSSKIGEAAVPLLGGWLLED